MRADHVHCCRSDFAREPYQTMYRCATAGALTVILVCLSGATIRAPEATAQAASCEQATDLFDLPPRIAYGRDLKILLNAGEGVQVFAADSGAVYPGTQVEPASPGVTRVVIPFKPGARARIELVKTVGVDGCIHQSSIVTPVAGIAPTARARDAIIDTGGGAQARGIFFEFRTPANCFETAPSAVSLTIRDGEKRRTASVSDPCLWDTTARSLRAPGWRFLQTEGLAGDIVAAPRLVPDWNKGYHRLRYSFSVGGRPIRSGTLAIRIGQDNRPITIYQGTDDFVNYCINGGKRITSRNGRLSCTRIFDDDISDDYVVSVSRDRRARAV